jgi:hypothetical protein
MFSTSLKWLVSLETSSSSHPVYSTHYSHFDHSHVLLYRQDRRFGAIGMGIFQFVVGGLIGKYGVIVPSIGNPPNANVIIQVEGAPAHTIIAFCYVISCSIVGVVIVKGMLRA